MMNRSKAINDIVEHFNWDRVHKAMVALDWRWASENVDDYGVPTLGALFKCAIDLLHRAYDGAEMHREDYIVATGGFRAQAYVDSDTKEIIELKLAFELCSWEHYVELDKESI